ncbi:MAG: hypothetical protein ACXWJN_06605 [Methyloceanibacter sp.]
MQKLAAGAAGWMSPSGATRTSLPWLLARFAHAVQQVVGQKGMVLLEKK